MAQRFKSVFDYIPVTSMLEKYCGNEPMDAMDDLNKILFTFAAYNCGPGRA